MPIYIPEEADSATKFHFLNNLQWFRTVQSGFTVYVITRHVTYYCTEMAGSKKQ